MIYYEKLNDIKNDRELKNKFAVIFYLVNVVIICAIVSIKAIDFFI